MYRLYEVVQQSQFNVNELTISVKLLLRLHYFYYFLCLYYRTYTEISKTPCTLTANLVGTKATNFKSALICYCDPQYSVLFSNSFILLYDSFTLTTWAMAIERFFIFIMKENSFKTGGVLDYEASPLLLLESTSLEITRWLCHLNLTGLIYTALQWSQILKTWS